MKKMLISLGASLLLFTNANAGIPVIDGAGIAQGNVQMALDESLDQLMQEFGKKLEEASLSEGLKTGDASIKGQQAYDTAVKQASEFGGAYGKDAANILQSCFDISLPSFSAGLGIKGLDFCGIDSLDNMRKNYMKGKSTSFDQQTLDKFYEKMTQTPGVKYRGKNVGSMIGDCIPGLGVNCEKTNKEIAEKEAKNGTTNGVSSNAAMKSQIEAIAKAKENEVDENGVEKDKVCVRNEQTGVTTKDLSCTQTNLKGFIENDKIKSDLNTSSSKLAGEVNKEQIKNDMKVTAEKSMQKLTDRNNEFRDIRDDYNIKYNPSKFAIDDVKAIGEDATYSKMKVKNELTMDTTMYIVPQIKDDKFTFGKYGIDNYNQAISDFNNITLTDPDGATKTGGDKDSVKKTVDRLGGITPFASALYGYEGIISVMAKNIYSNGEENGEVGRELAIINGLKGNMYQTLILNQQLENKARSDYNIRIKEFDKLSADNDAINSNLEMIQHQNSLIINLLTELNNNIKKLK